MPIELNAEEKRDALDMVETTVRQAREDLLARLSRKSTKPVLGDALYAKMLKAEHLLAEVHDAVNHLLAELE